MSSYIKSKTPFQYKLKKEQFMDSIPPNLPNYQLTKEVQKIQLFLEKADLKSTLSQEKMLRNQQQQTDILREQADLLKQLVHLMKKNNKIQASSTKTDKQSMLGKEKNQQEPRSKVRQFSLKEQVVKQKKYNLHYSQGQGNANYLMQTNRISQQIKTKVSNQANDQSNQMGLEIIPKKQQIDYKQKIIKISLQPFLKINEQNSEKMITLFQKPIKVYIQNLLKTLSQSSFYGYYSAKDVERMSYDETKAFFSKNLVYNYFQMINGFRDKYSSFWSLNSNKILGIFNKKLKQSLSYFKFKYPQKQKTYLNQNQIKQIEIIDNSQIYIGSIFKAFINSEQDSLEISQKMVKQFLNFLIKQTRKDYDNFQRQMLEIFTIKYNGKSVLQNSIGAKLPKTAEEYSKQQIQRQGIDIKIPQVIRVIVKWIEGLQNIIINSEVKSLNFFKDAQYDDQKELQIEDAKQRRTQIIKSFEPMKKKLEDNNTGQEQLYLNNIQNLIPEIIERHQDSFPPIPNSDLKVGLFTTLVSKSIVYLTQGRLLKLLHLFQKFYNDKKQLPFEVFDLLRAKCSGTIDQIKEVYQNLKSSPQIQIIRTKNRLDTGNRDLLINFIMKGSSLICQVQLNINDGKSYEKQEYYDHFNHFLYELQRSKYGPVCEAVNIIRNIENNFTYFQSKKFNLLNNKSSVFLSKYKQSVQISKQGITMQGFDISLPLQDFICNNCYSYKTMYSSDLTIAVSYSQNQNNSKIVLCQRCLIQILNPDEVVKHILGYQYSEMFKSISPKQFLETKPEYIIIVKQGSPRIVCGYKRYTEIDDSEENPQKQVRYFSCMFSIESSAKYNNMVPLESFEINQHYKTFLNDAFIFVLKEDGQNQIRITTTTSQFKHFPSKLISYSTINGELEIDREEVEDQLNQLVSVVVLNQDKAFLLDVQSTGYQQNVQKYQKLEEAKNLVKLLKKTGQSSWDLIGDYENVLFELLQPISNNCKVIYINLYEMTLFPEISCENLLECTIAITQTSKIKLSDLKAPQMATLFCFLNETEISLASDFPKLKTIKINIQKTSEISFKNVAWKEADDIFFAINSFGRVTGFEENVQNPCQFKNLRLFSMNSLTCSKIDLTKFKLGKKIEMLQCIVDQGVITFPFPFVSADNYQSSCFTVCYRASQDIGTQIPGESENSNRLTSFSCDGLKAKQLTINCYLPQLTSFSITYGYPEKLSFDFECPQLIRLTVQMTSMKTLDISKLPKLTYLAVRWNQLTNIRMKDLDQMLGIEQMALDYNFYSQNFFGELSIESFQGQRISSGSINNYYMISNLTESQYEQFMSVCKQKTSTTEDPFTRSDVITGRRKVAQYINQNLETDSFRWPTSLKIQERQAQFQVVRDAWEKKKYQNLQ